MIKYFNKPVKIKENNNIYQAIQVRTAPGEASILFFKNGDFECSAILTKPLNKKELLEHLELHIRHRKKLEKMFRDYKYNGFGRSLDKNAFSIPNNGSDEKSVEFRKWMFDECVVDDRRMTADKFNENM